MELLTDRLSRLFLDAAAKVAQELKTAAVDMSVVAATQSQFGHYQWNGAMKLAKLLKRPPRELATQIVDAIDCSLFASIEVAGAGFINLTLKNSFLSEELTCLLRDPEQGRPPLVRREKIVVEFSSPNIAKEMHVGHLRSTIIGDALARLFEFLGHEVVRLNHVGDWGTAFGMLIAYMQEEASDVLEEKQEADLAALMAWYRTAKVRFDEDPEFKIRARQTVVALQAGDPSLLKAWELICALSRRAFEQIYALLGVRLQERGESFYNPLLPQVVADLEAKGLITLSDGAKCVFHEGLSIPLMVQKSDGGYNYDTTDMAAIRQRIEEEKADRIVVVTDAGQSLHFELVRKTAEKAGYLDPKRVRFDHVPFGLVLGTDGKKFRTRSGETEKLSDLLHTAIEEAKTILKTRNPEKQETEIEEMALTLGIDAVKYADLSCNRLSDYVFSYEKMLRFEGNTAAFILYSYVRIKGIQRKVGILDLSSLIPSTAISITHPSEIDLGLHLLRFREQLKKVERDLLPSDLTEYLYALAQKFNAFFRDCRVEGSAEQNSRLLLCELTLRTLEQGLHILGLKTLTTM